MEVMDKRKKAGIIKGIAFNSIVFFGCALYIWLYIYPKYEALGVLNASINETIVKTGELKIKGVNAATFSDLLTRLGRKNEVPAVIFADSAKLNRALAKPENVKKNYLIWLIGENAKITDLDREIQENDRILGNIIPVFTNSSEVSLIDNQITLASFISYVEKDIFGKYSLSSYVPLGIANISFPNKKESPVNIGSFKLMFDFKGKNSNILSFINTIQSSGKLTIRNGKIVPDNVLDSSVPKQKGLSSLSNLLIKIDALSLEKIPTVLSEENKGNMTLEFYVEGMNYQKILALRSLLSIKFDSLKKPINEKGALCSKPGNSLCNETITANAIAGIKGLIKNITALQPKIDAFGKGDITIDANKEIETLSDIKSTLQSIEMVYQKNNSILEKSTKQPNTK